MKVATILFEYGLGRKGMVNAGLGSIGKLHRRPEGEQCFRLAKTAKQAMSVLSSIKPDSARWKKGRSKPDRVFRQSLRQTCSVRRVTPSVLLMLVVIFLATDSQSAPVPQANHRKTRIEGMLIGTLLGDAAGGPVEFKTPQQVVHVMPATRSWPQDRILTHEEIKTLARSFPLLSYAELRPDPEPYAQWTARAPAGTLTDDSRQKMILLNTLRYAKRHDSFPITRRDFAASTSTLSTPLRCDLRDTMKGCAKRA
ncbi:MAG: ADP-ribosylglycohydrolase family protein [Planctomycetes bacterium]|nr:ADP-ribosylglycohydrolase family protein [Planctomycetota bacterium]